MNDKDNQRKEALKRLHMLHELFGIDKTAISDFETGKIPLSIEFFPSSPISAISLSDRPDLENKVKHFEKKQNCTAYYVLNSCNVFLTILYVSNYTEDWDYERPHPEGNITAVVYDLSGKFMGADETDFGECGFIESDGALKRVI
ncbi:hypothetical protein IMSAGC007_00893 [Lachnospiraceae bacterium]|nr:hypothetical protein IMSAGC007_00893 [Lachnospiraceae bacterium]